MTKQAHEKLVEPYHQTVSVGTTKNIGSSSMPEMEVVELPNYKNPEGEKVGHIHEEVMGHEPKHEHMAHHAKHMGHEAVHHVHHASHEKSHSGEQGGHEGYRSSEGGHPHHTRGDHKKHGHK